MSPAISTCTLNGCLLAVCGLLRISLAIEPITWYSAFMTAAKNIVICDDHPFVRKGVEISISDKLKNCRYLHAGNERELIGQVGQGFQIDLILLDYQLPDRNGLTLLQDIKNISPQTRVILLSSNQSPWFLSQVVKSSCAAAVHKSTSAEELVSIIEQVFSGGRGLILDKHYAQCWEKYEVLGFTPREIEVLNEIVQGKENQEIADHLGCALTTIRFHRANIMSKANVKNAAELTAWYLGG